jgi:hypothetical protein
MSNPYLEKLRELEHAGISPGVARGGFVSFVSAGNSPISGFEIPKSAPCGNRQNRQNLPGYQATPRGGLHRVLDVLDSSCPDHIDHDTWRAAVEDGRRFLATWGEQAERLGWAARHLFGLFPVPENPHPSFSRLSRYEHTGLIWLLHGCPVIALTEATAAIQNPSGAITIYRKHNKPALGPTGDSLEDLE